MINVKDRIVQYPRRYQLVPANESQKIYDLVPIPGTITEEGTLVNRSLLMALQGFTAKTTVFNVDGSITETNGSGHSKVTTFNGDGSITETFTAGTMVISKTTIFNADGSITEEVN